MFCFAVIVEKTENPLSGGRFPGALVKRGDDARDRGQIAGHHSEMIPSGICWMGVGIDEPGQNGTPSEVDLATAAGGQSQDFLRRANGYEPAAANGRCLGTRLFSIDGPDICVVQN